MILQSKASGDFKPHPEGIYPAVCVDVIDLGLMESEYLGQRRMVQKVRLVFETEHVNEEGQKATLAKTFTASLNAKAKLAEFLGKWRGRPVVPGESIDLSKLIGACSTLVVSQQQNMVGRTYASIDAVSKPTKKLAASGGYDPVLARQRIEEWKAREAGNPKPETRNPKSEAQNGEGVKASTFRQSGGGAPHSKAPVGAAPAATADFDPEVGF